MLRWGVGVLGCIRMLNISGINKADLLAALYNNSRTQGMGFLSAKPGNMTRDEAAELLKETQHFDYLHGRVMKVNLSKDEFDPWLYDRDLGQGAAQRVVEALKTATP